MANRAGSLYKFQGVFLRVKIFFMREKCWEERVMLKNIFRGFIVLCGSIVLPFTAYAGFFSNPYNHYYVDVGTAVYYDQVPRLEVGTSGSGTAPLAKSAPHDVAPQLNLAGGYQFMNCNDNLLAKIFGHEEAIEAKVDYTYLDNTNSKADLGLGNVWYIDGSISIFSPPSPKPLNNFKLNSKVNNIDTGVYFKGKIYTTNPRVTMLRYVGLVYNYYDTKYDYKLNYMGGTISNTEEENFNVIANYIGIALGSQLNYQITKHLTPFIDLEVRLLNVSANLDATQSVPDAVVGPKYMTVHDSDSSFSYQAIAALGINYLFNDSLKSPSVGFRVGVDHWNYVPRVVPPNYAGDKPVHIVGDTANNSFAMLDVHVPFG